MTGLPSPAAVPPETGFATSGRTGPPVRWWRTARQLAAEVDLLTGAVLGPVEQVVNFAPPQHLFGRLFGEILPQRRGTPVHHLWQDPAAAPEWRPGLRTLFVCLPSSWLPLRSVADRIAELPYAVALHGTGPVTGTARRVVRALHGRDFRAVEVFGSTETGAVAVRDIDPPGTGTSGDWRLLPDVAVDGLADGRTCRLTVRSPRLARRDGDSAPPELLRTDDVVCGTGDRTFRFLGRASRLIKVNGVRCDLERVEEAASRSLPGCEVVCVPGRDTVRGEHYEVFYTDPSGTVPPETVWTVLRATAGATALPRAVRRVAAVPRSATGKPRPHLLAEGGVR